jgi:hypothetical protein
MDKKVSGAGIGLSAALGVVFGSAFDPIAKKYFH